MPETAIAAVAFVVPLPISAVRKLKNILRQPLGIVLVGFVEPHLQCSLHSPGVQTLRCLPPTGPIRMAREVPTISKNRLL
jgi:hypothetical protein